ASGIEFPAQNWADYSDRSRGVALLNIGLPGNLVTDGPLASNPGTAGEGVTLLLSLLRSHNLGAYGFGGGYEPGMSSESGFELGRTHTFRYAVSHMPVTGSKRPSIATGKRSILHFSSTKPSSTLGRCLPAGACSRSRLRMWSLPLFGPGLAKRPSSECMRPAGGTHRA